jgi:AbrB family looped-hinge helix DNA binding protein
MQDFARVTSKGQITIPKAVREALCLKKGDAVLFMVDDESREVTVKRVPGLMEIAGSLEVPEDQKGKSWKEIRAETRRIRAAERR